MATESNYWRSLRELHDGSSVREHKANEFMSGVTDDFDVEKLSTMSRKQFLSLLTASAAFAAAGCSSYRDKGEIVPYTKKPEEITPGVANFYASTCTLCPQACGILIKTREGRPIKIDGNPDHAINMGKICSKGQASVLNLYDPYRLRKPQYGTASGAMENLSWEKADADMIKHLESARKDGKEIAIVTRELLSPTGRALLSEFLAKYPTAQVYAYQPFNDGNRRRAWQSCYGESRLPVIAWERARVILALEADILGTEGMVVEQIRKFVAGRDVMTSDAFNRLYAVEGTVSLTGANADYRMRLRSDAQLDLVLALLNEILVVRGGKFAHDRIGRASLTTFAASHGLSIEVLRHLVDDLLANRGNAMVYAGNGMPEDVHVATNYLNEVLGNSALYSTSLSRESAMTLTPPDGFASLVKRMGTGSVAVVVHYGANPIYDLPGALGYEAALKSVPVSVSLTETDDETSRHCTYVLPVNHSFEAWGDYTVRSGILSLQQPVIAPLYETRQKESVLLRWMNSTAPYQEDGYHQYLMRRWEKEVFPSFGVKNDFKSFWYASLHDGVVTIPGATGPALKFGEQVLDGISTKKGTDRFTVTVTESYHTGDGSLANNGWLQELPHPVSKMVWDNYAAIAPATAKRLEVVEGDLIEIRFPHGTVQIPVFPQPGQAEDCITIASGYGRTNAGPVGTGVGSDASSILPVASLAGTYLLTDAEVVKTGEHHVLVSTQEHHALDDEFTKELHLKRQIVREGTVEEYRKNPRFLHEKKEALFNIAPTVEYHGVKWAMAIDLNKCIGCNACTAGCNVENNIPVVGKEQVANGREMHWIRIDRYYAGTDAAPSLSTQPMLCQHCDNAPCENVCPVVATNHSPDGLNQMAYNRCVGTKYCSNNCPYKVRRFNFFNWRDRFADGYYEQEPTSLVHNPEVTVRSRGVMEKCTFCIQRIMEARQHATEQGRVLKGSDVTTACQEACPATAIVFGDMNDPGSEISKYREHDLGYHVLEETNARPNVTYVAKLRNTHPETNA